MTIMHDWRLVDAPEPGIDARPWRLEIREASAVSFRIEATCPEGTRRDVWIEIQDGKLVLHAYDPDHEEPVNLRISRTGIIVDSDRGEEFLKHYDLQRYEAMEALVRALSQTSLPEEEATGDVEEHIADLGEEQLFGAYHAFMDLVRSARVLQT